MSTRATIAVRRADGFYDAVYLHYDGYPDHTGAILMHHYANQADAANLVAGGDLRCLQRESGEPEYFSDGHPAVMMPTGAALIEFARNCGAKYVYVFEDGTWSCKEF
ncbi:hypothetical protein [Novipirellula artificiosorum]|uniref:Uncharacterized protein n=1 Tax=Novipirellula artificiosorum TaxID=2528016 RepID=A0A5C6DWB2_9BACT|nr:hypothetical protein [Novipirellula artificiosorum]TWU39346.1 hypothetical protein Poly41_21700 [Novipirellula artificiosorum]